jgi:hypothetical protein
MRHKPHNSDDEQDAVRFASSGNAHIDPSSRMAPTRQAQTGETMLATSNLHDEDIMSREAVVALTHLLGAALDRIVNSHGQEEP